MTAAGFAQILNQATALQAAGGAYAENPRRISRSRIALCIKAAFAPQDNLSLRMFCGVVGQLHPRSTVRMEIYA